MTDDDPHDLLLVHNHPMRVHPLSAGFGLAFLLEYPHGLYLVDAGSPGREGAVLRKMAELGRSDLKLIWITHAHYDHYGSAAALHRLTGAAVGVHPADAPSLAAGISPLGSAHGRGAVLRLAQGVIGRLWPLPPVQADITVEDGGSLVRWGLEASVLHTPGHTPGHTCLLLEDGTAFAADLVARNPRPRLQDLLATGWSELPDSLARLQAAHPQRVYTGHSRRPLSGQELMQIRVRNEARTIRN